MRLCVIDEQQHCTVEQQHTRPEPCTQLIRRTASVVKAVLALLRHELLQARRPVAQHTVHCCDSMASSSSGFPNSLTRLPGAAALKSSSAISPAATSAVFLKDSDSMTEQRQVGSSGHSPVYARPSAPLLAGGQQHLQEQLQKQQLDPYKVHKLFMSGALAGAISRTMTAPIDRLKMIMQVQDDARRGMTLREGVQRMSAEGSWRTFFKGNGANVIKIAPETAMKLTLNDHLKLVLSTDPAHPTPWQRMAAGGLAGAIAQFLTYPLDTIRTRLAVSRHGTYQGIFHAASSMSQHEGLRAFYRGLVPSMIGILPYAGVDIALFEIFKQQILDEADRTGRPAPHFSLLAVGMLSSSIAQVVSYPLALIRTRLQAQGVAGAPCKYKGMSDVLAKTLEREGVRGLYKGLLPNIFKLAPAAGISWYVFEESKRSLGLDPRI